jgi:DNA repair protein RecO (recombination protein O)
VSEEGTAYGVVLRRSETGESDRQLSLFTAEFGVLRIVAKGARKPGSRLAGASEPLAHGRFTFARSRARRYLQRADSLQGWPGLRKDYGKLAAALGLAQLAELSLPHESPAPEVFEWLVESLGAMEAAARWPPVFVWAAARLLDVEGLRPRWIHDETGSPLVANPAWVSPRAGGHVGAPEPYPDAFPARAEALIAMEKATGLASPPGHLRFAPECVALAVRYWAETLGSMPSALKSLPDAV